MAEWTTNGEILRQTLKKDVERKIKKLMSAEMKYNYDDYEKVDDSISTFFSGYKANSSMGVVAAPSSAAYQTALRHDHILRTQAVACFKLYSVHTLGS